MNIIEKIRKFMAGRYGFDQFGRFLFLLTLVTWAICFICRFFPFYKVYLFFSLLNTAIYIYAIFRILSRNIYNRTVENERYLHLRNKVLPFIEEKKKTLGDKQYIYKKCPRCKAKLRLKRIKGRHTTQCPKCGKKFHIRVFIEYQQDYGNDMYGY